MLDLKKFVQQVRVCDGAWGTEMQKRGLSAGAAPELWNTERPEAVEDVARGYVQAGSDVILTNTFGGNRFVLERHNAGDRAGELAEAAAKLSRKAAGEDVKVFGSMGPTGKVVMMQETPPEQIREAFAEQASALARGGVDAIVLETFNELAELRLALEAATDATDLPVVACMTFASGAERMATMMGEGPGDLLAACEELGADAVGANCGLGPDNYVKVARAFREASSLPIWIKANAGLPQIGPGGETVFPMPADEFGQHVPALVDAGANILGGCCGTDPNYVRAIRSAVDAL
ncbi:MAG: homocysteine S-methyltransferase family protein [Planctomycetota bacterium]